MNDHLNGALFKALMVSGLKNLDSHRETVNGLNVFPVPDGDTGTNMCMTLENGIAALDAAALESLPKTVTAFGKSVVLGARGNSGVILSQFLKGVCDKLSAYQTASVPQFYDSFSYGVKTAYGAVVNPTEGTMLTVLREAADYVINTAGGGEYTLADVLRLFLRQAAISLENTPELLDVLKKAGVVDSGGQGVVYFFEGMLKYLEGEEIDSYAPALEVPVAKKYDYSLIDGNTEYVYGYCTELLVQIKDGISFDERAFTKELSALGESIVISTIIDKFKIHVHTFYPEKVLALCHNYGEMLAVKIENMDVQHISEQAEKSARALTERVSLATVAVSPDKKLGKVFTDMGASAIVDGGDTCNPSVSDFITVFDSVNAKEILVFPNSANVVLTALQAADAYDKCKITVANCTSLAECYSTLALVDYAATAEENADMIDDAIQNVTTLTVFKAARDSVFGDDKISAGEYVAVNGKTLVFKNCGLVNTVVSAVESYLEDHDKDVITLFAGKKVGENDLNDIVDKLQKFTPFSDVITVLTDNPVHEFTISLE